MASVGCFWCQVEVGQNVAGSLAQGPSERDDFAHGGGDAVRDAISRS